jgi:anthranilate synthase/aminodeoxychorismate synthase-like glutamine amidotransferase
LYKFTKIIYFLQRILLLDNYDSFTFNLAHYLTNLGAHVDVVRNDAFDGNFSAYDKIVLSPGPGLPNDAGMLMQIIEDATGKIPILGVCLGMQAIALSLGGELYNLNSVKHGVQESISTSDSVLFKNLPAQIEVGLYHSWAVKSKCGNFTQTAVSSENVMMGLENADKKLYAVQFHPESVMTPTGIKILENFLGMV